MDNPAIEAEFQKHEAWKQKTQIKGTPTVLVNGYQLPETNNVEDLRYFTSRLYIRLRIHKRRGYGFNIISAWPRKRMVVLW